MQIGIPKEQLAGEKRIAATPSTVAQLKKLGFTVAVEKGAGLNANFSDEAYLEAGAELVEKEAAWQSDIVLKINGPITTDQEDEIELLREGTTLISLISPAQNEEMLSRLAAKGVTTMAMDMVPRISRSQSMDVLSSMANIAGYRAVIEAAHHFGRFFSGQITAAGKVPPAKVMIIGAGVAGLAAIGAAGSLGAQVRAFDTRPEVKEQINSMGAEFLEVTMEEEAGIGDGYARVMSKEYIAAEMELFREQAREVDIIITTALIPGRPAPKLILDDMVESLRPGSVIVDLAAPNGGNCTMTEPGKVVVKSGVTIIGYTDLPSRMSGQASQLFGTNLVNLLKLLCKGKDGTLTVDFDDVVIRGVTVVKGSEITYPPPAVQVSSKQPAPAKPIAQPEKEKKEASKPWLQMLFIAIGACAIASLGAFAPAQFLGHFTVFVLSCVLGYYVIWNVTHSLHTPLMSVTNAISGIIIVGALLQIGHHGLLIKSLAFIAVLITSINIFGGFFVTHRMLKMFRKED
ncbi:MAG: Re/Si-specific NAD(P)(+) transhydrogenase subunit alpha [Desulforhopalus sp.]|nr:Re/Si-specific NAD(P)(+) transhydrogenase subunit alpha [Desulforhopalus sp.]